MSAPVLTYDDSRQQSFWLGGKVPLKLRAPCVDFFAVHGNGRGSGDAEPNFFALDCNDRDANVAIDHNFFADPSRENQHGHSFLNFFES